MKKYESPFIQLVAFHAEDVLGASQPETDVEEVVKPGAGTNVPVGSLDIGF
jgi:hypothetical protein